jgi:hypothetical protein
LPSSSGSALGKGNPLPSAGLEALGKDFSKKNFPLPSVLLEALGKEFFFFKKISLLFAERLTGGARQRRRHGSYPP